MRDDHSERDHEETNSTASVAGAYPKHLPQSYGVSVTSIVL